MAIHPMHYIYCHVSVVKRQHPVAWQYRSKRVLPVDKLIEALALIATIKAIDLFASWLKEKNR